MCNTAIVMRTYVIWINTYCLGKVSYCTLMLASPMMCPAVIDIRTHTIRIKPYVDMNRIAGTVISVDDSIQKGFSKGWNWVRFYPFKPLIADNAFKVF